MTAALLILAVVIALPLMAWGAIAAGVVILALSIGVKVQTSRLDSCKEASAAFQAQVAAEGAAAAKEAARVNLANQKAKEQADAKTKRLLADNAVLGKRLRDARARSGYVPAAAPGTRSPDVACFGRAELERAIGNLDAGLQGIAGQGDAFGLRLSTAAEWAASLAK